MVHRAEGKESMAGFALKMVDVLIKEPTRQTQLVVHRCAALQFVDQPKATQRTITHRPRCWGIGGVKAATAVMGR
jgi:hypothetical protein